ncbi:uncharacterized protein LOC110117074 [Athalia rosae]|uniref:uncharacterized protein LOC110117074 n=1 Tax=Athalia rosae TaxID=37344 RepID=UPI0020337D5C|nr:uncharacterized protein LOC110117074 [Athalia rosae]
MCELAMRFKVSVEAVICSTAFIVRFVHCLSFWLDKENASPIILDMIRLTSVFHPLCEMVDLLISAYRARSDPVRLTKVLSDIVLKFNLTTKISASQRRQTQND